MGTITDIMAPLLVQADALVAAAEARAIKAEADRAEAKRLVAAAMAIFANDNDTDDVPPPVAPVMEAAAPIVAEAVPVVEVVEAIAPARTFKGKADKAILDVLAGVWMCARMIHDAVTATGVKITRPAIYQRMPILLALYPDLIEQNGDAQEWRSK